MYSYLVYLLDERKDKFQIIKKNVDLKILRRKKKVYYYFGRLTRRCQYTII